MRVGSQISAWPPLTFRCALQRDGVTSVFIPQQIRQSHQGRTWPVVHDGDGPGHHPRDRRQSDLDSGYAVAELETVDLLAAFSIMGVPQDYAEAMRLYRMAAEQGEANSQYGLGLMYEAGKGVTAHNVEAHMWLNIAGANGIEASREKRNEIELRMTSQDVSEAQRHSESSNPGAESVLKDGERTSVQTQT